MNVRMVLQVLAPGMEHRDEADLSTEVARIGGDRAQCFGCGPEQDGVDRCLVLESDFGGRRRQGEDDVEIRHRQQFVLPFGQPSGARRSLAFRAMPVATGNGRRPLRVLWVNPVMGSWRQLVRGPAAVAASSAHHYEARFSSAINLSVGWKTPRRRCGGTIASIASSFSVGSPRV